MLCAFNEKAIRFCLLHLKLPSLPSHPDAAKVAILIFVPSSLQSFFFYVYFYYHIYGKYGLNIFYQIFYSFINFINHIYLHPTPYRPGGCQPGHHHWSLSYHCHHCHDRLTVYTSTQYSTLPWQINMYTKKN